MMNHSLNHSLRTGALAALFALTLNAGAADKHDRERRMSLTKFQRSIRNA